MISFSGHLFLIYLYVIICLILFVTFSPSIVLTCIHVATCTSNPLFLMYFHCTQLSPTSRCLPKTITLDICTRPPSLQNAFTKTCGTMSLVQALGYFRGLLTSLPDSTFDPMQAKLSSDLHYKIKSKSLQWPDPFRISPSDEFLREGGRKGKRKEMREKARERGRQTNSSRLNTHI